MPRPWGWLRELRWIDKWADRPETISQLAAVRVARASRVDSHSNAMSCTSCFAIRESADSMVHPTSFASRSFEHRFRLIGAKRHSKLYAEAKRIRATLVIVACLLRFAGFRVATSGNFASTTNLRIEVASLRAKTQLQAIHATGDATVGPPITLRRCINDDHIALSFDGAFTLGRLASDQSFGMS